MKLWKRASGALKDQNSLWIASLSRRTALRNPEIETAVIKACSHDESRVDYKNPQRIYAWIRVSPAHLRSVLWTLSSRMSKTRSWAVALKGLMLMHGIFCCKVPEIQKIGRLPFDLSNFMDAHLSPGRAWPYNAFVHVYYAFLDQKSAFICLELQDWKKARNRKDVINISQNHPQKQQQLLMHELVRLQRLQALLDLLMQIKPQSTAQGIKMKLILEAMDCIIIEIFDVYSRICGGIARVLLNVCSAAGKAEARMALEVMHKATVQGEDLCSYFEFCRDLGVLNASECPKIEKIPEEDFRELERIINGASKMNNFVRKTDEKAIIVRETGEESKGSLKTIITHKWEVFEEDLIKLSHDDDETNHVGKDDPFAASLRFPALHVNGDKNQGPPDLISFL